MQTGAGGNFQLENLRPAQYPADGGTARRVDLQREGRNGADLCRRRSSGRFPSDGRRWSAGTSLEIGAVKPASVSGDLWLDENKDGIRQTDEQRLSGVTLELVNPATGGRVAAAASTEDGFRFDNVRPGTYLLRFELPAQAETAGESDASFRQNGSRMEMANLTVKEGEEITGSAPAGIQDQYRQAAGSAFWETAIRRLPVRRSDCIRPERKPRCKRFSPARTAPTALTACGRASMKSKAICPQT